MGEGKVTYKIGNLLTEEAEALVNTVNCVGVMGRGVALQFKRVFPDNFNLYSAACRRGEVRPGSMLVYDTKKLTNPRYVINFPTKRHWRGKSRMADIDAGLVDLTRVIRELGIQSIALPPLGSGLGGLEWSNVRPRIQASLEKVEGLEAVVFEPQAQRDSMPLPRGEAPNMTPGRAALIGLLQQYLYSLLDPYATLLEVHKLMYFMQESGEPLHLRFRKALYGPYAENLRHVLQAVEGYYLTGYMGADLPNQPLGLVPGAIEDANEVLAASNETRERFNRVGSLVAGFETPHGLELLATVHWVVQREGARGLDEVTDHTYAWGARKRRFTRAQIKLALDRLVGQGWLAA